MAKVRKDPFQYTAPWSYTVQQDGVLVSETTGDHGLYAPNSVYLGDSPTDWKWRLLEGRDATSELIGERYTSGYTPMFYEHQGLKPPVLGQTHVRRGGVDPAVNYLGYPGLTPLARAEGEAATALLESYKNAVHQFRGLDFLAELAESIAMITQPQKSMLNYAVGFYRKVGKIKAYAVDLPRTYAKKLGSLYLGFKFGIEPLASDLANAGALATSFFEDAVRKKTARISGKGVFAETVDQGQRYIDSAAYAIQDIWIARSSEVRYNGIVSMDLNFPYPAIARAGLTLPDVVPAVWEGIPTSFITSYFTNVDSVLYRGTTASASPFLNYVSKGVRNVLEIAGGPVRFRNDHPDVLDGYIAGSASGGSFVTRRVAVHRSSGAELPPVTLNFKVPSFQSGLNLAALAVAVQKSKPT